MRSSRISKSGSATASRPESPTPTRTPPTSRAAWASSTTATIPPICAAATARPTSTARTCSTSPTDSLRPRSSATDTLAGKALDSWALHGVAVIQSGQPYSVIDYSGAVGSIFYSTFNGITNPIVPWLARVAREKRADRRRMARSTIRLPGADAALKASCFTDPTDPGWHHGRSRRRPV